MSKNESCAHAPCDCPVSQDGSFCSDACRQAHERGDLECPCAHKGCGSHP